MSVKSSFLLLAEAPSSTEVVHEPPPIWLCAAASMSRIVPTHWAPSLISLPYTVASITLSLTRVDPLHFPLETNLQELTFISQFTEHQGNFPNIPTLPALMYYLFTFKVLRLVYCNTLLFLPFRHEMTTCERHWR